jgi:D-lactate dehydrogenase
MDKIVFFEIEKWEEDYIKNLLSEQNVVFSNEKLTLGNAANFTDANIVSTFIYSTINKELLDKLPNLKFITTRSMGFDHIDIAACKDKGVVVADVPTYGSHTVAEHTFALILALSRKIIPAVEKARRGEFSPNGLEGFDLFGKTLGVIGAGHIGTNVIDLGLAFGMKVLVFSKHEDLDLVSKGVKYLSLDELLANSDIVSLHLPHTSETEHIINMNNINKFKKGAILINTARGALVETQAILEALEKGILQGAGLDVLEEETVLKEERELLSSAFLKTADFKTGFLNHVLLTRDDVVITPHNAFNSKEALIQIIDTTIANIKNFIEKTPINVIE